MKTLFDVNYICISNIIKEITKNGASCKLAKTYISMAYSNLSYLVLNEIISVTMTNSFQCRVRDYATI